MCYSSYLWLPVATRSAGWRALHRMWGGGRWQQRLQRRNVARGVLAGGILIKDWERRHARGHTCDRGCAVLVWGLLVEGGEVGVGDSDFDATTLPVGVLAGEILVEG